jgi:predicted ATPase/DNA-binding SARP family transcriptional activator
MVYVKLLGSPYIELNTQRFSLPAGKKSALLYLLAYRDGWVRREELTYLFWPESDEGDAKRNLRQLLLSLKRSPRLSGLEIEPARVRWPVDTDVRRFYRALAAKSLATAMQLYEGELLQAYHAAGLHEFEVWLEGERQSVAKRWRTASLGFVAELEQERRHAQAADLLTRLHKADPLDESLFRRALSNLYSAGQRDEALEAFAGLVRTLEQFGGEPEAKTLRLADAVRRGEVESAGDATAEARSVAVPPGPSSPRHNLPLPPTPFVGRQAQKQALAKDLADPTCRLLSLIGVGGVGKTRLALEVALTQVAQFRDGVWFVSLVSLGSADFIVSAVADALRFSFYGATEPRLQLLDYLRGRQLLLVMDNFEHVLAGAVLIADILQTAPGVKVLATSRERLNLQAERVVYVGGLSYPELTGPTDPRGSDAVQLFLQSAKKSAAAFDPSETELATVARICALVEGLPLALELAGAWLDTLSLFEIAEEIEQGLTVLASPRRDAPERHQSIRAVLDHSWRLLSEEEQRVLSAVSVFSGSFSREAAVEVAGATLPTLQALVHKSLLYKAEGRYARHPLVWHYTREQAAMHPQEEISTRNRHAAFYGRFMSEREEWAKGGSRQKQVGPDIGVEHDNLRAAWAWAGAQRDAQTLDYFIECLSIFYSSHGYAPAQAINLFQAAVDALGDKDPRVTVKLLARQALFYLYLDELDIMLGLCEQSLAVVDRYNLPLDPMIYGSLSGYYANLGQFDQAFLCLSKAAEHCRANGDQWRVEIILFNMGITKCMQGEFADAEPYFSESIEIGKRLQDFHTLSASLLNLGNVYRATGRLDEAKEVYEESIQLALEVGSKLDLANALVHLGALNLFIKEIEQAELYYLEALPLLRDLDFQTPPQKQEVAGAHLTHGLNGLGETLVASGRYSESLEYFREALAVALRFHTHASARSSALESIAGAAAALMGLR